MAYTISSNTPAAGSIQWTGLHIQYMGVSYTIVDGYTNAIYAYWTPLYPNNLVITNSYPNLAADECLLFLNKNGTAVTVPTSTIIQGDLIVPGSIVTDKIAANAITSDLIAAGAVTADTVAANAIGAENIVAGAIIAEKLATGAVTANTVAANAIGAGAIAANAVTADKIAAGSISADKIQVGAGAVSTSNLMAGKTPSGTSTDAALTNGVRNVGSPPVTFGSGNQSNNAAESAYVQIDLGAVYRVAESRAFWYCTNSVRSYYYKLKYSADGTNWFYAVGNASNTGWCMSAMPTAAQAASTDSYFPTVDSFPVPIVARYLKLVANGNTSTVGNHIYEWEAYSTAQTTIDGRTISTGTITASEIAAATITGAKIVADAITAREIASRTITANEITAGTLTANEIASATITAGNLAAGTITSTSACIGSLNADKITAGSITSANYVLNTSGTKISMADGTIDTKNFKLTAAGDITLKGDLYCSDELYMDNSNKSRAVMYYQYSNPADLLQIGFMDKSNYIHFENTTSLKVYSPVLEIMPASKLQCDGISDFYNSIQLKSCGDGEGGQINWYDAAGNPTMYQDVESNGNMRLFYTGGANKAMNMFSTGGYRFDLNVSGNITGTNVYVGTQRVVYAGNNDITYLREAAGYMHVQANSGAYGCNWWASDIKWKHDVVDTGVSGLAMINAIKHREYVWNEDAPCTTPGQIDEVGYIAQEMAALNEKFVIRIVQEDETENLQINEYKIIPYMTKAIQELSEENEALATKLATMEERLTALESK